MSAGVLRCFTRFSLSCSNFVLDSFAEMEAKTDDKNSRVPNYEELDDIADNICDCWESVGRHLNIN